MTILEAACKFSRDPTDIAAFTAGAQFGYRAALDRAAEVAVDVKCQDHIDKVPEGSRICCVVLHAAAQAIRDLKGGV